MWNRRDWQKWPVLCINFYAKVTIWGNNFAVSSDGIATALQDSASALMEAGNNLEQSVALVAAANKVVQDPNSVGE